MDPYSEKAFRIVLVGGTVMIAFCIVLLIFSVSLTDWGQANMFKTTASGYGSINIRESGPGQTALVTAMADQAWSRYSSVREWGEILKFNVAFDIVGAPAETQKWLGHKNQFSIKGNGDGDTFEYVATAVEGDFVGTGDILLRGNYPDKNGVTTEASISLDSSDGKSIMEIDVINTSTGRPVSDFELDAIGNYTFQQYLQLNQTMRDKITEEDFCSSLDRILPRDFSGIYIAPHGKKLTADADLIDRDVPESNVTEEETFSRFAAEQALMDEYRAEHPEEFEEQEEPEPEAEGTE